MYFENSYLIAKKLEISNYQAIFASKFSELKKIKQDKINLIKEAKEIASKLNMDEAREYSNKLLVLSPQLNTTITKDNKFLVAKDFESSRNFEQARILYLEIIKDESQPLELKIKSYNAYRTTYKLERKLSLFIEKTYEMEKFFQELKDQDPTNLSFIEAWADSKIALIKAVWTDHKTVEAKELAQELIKEENLTSNQKAQTFWILGSIYLELKNNKLALSEFLKASEIKIKDLALSENIQWAVVWNQFLLKEYKHAIINIDKFISKTNNNLFIGKLKFWKAYSLQNTNNVKLAREIFSKIYEEDSFSYYGILSKAMLSEKLSHLNHLPVSEDQSNDLIFDWLIATDEKKLAQAYLKEIDNTFKTFAQREKAMTYYLEANWFQGAIRQSGNFPAKNKNQLIEKYSHLIFPTPYLDFVTSLSQKYQVPKELVYAIIRQESVFVETERSWADAFGLMQLIPEKAHELSKKYSINYKEISDLYRSEINIELGVALLSDLREMYQHKFVQTVASYNASHSVVKTWEKERLKDNYIEFIEMIPYEETRNYVKHVFKNYITYKRILNSDGFELHSNFFELPFN
jgi:soluble lytic murein transglycosylase